MPMASGAEPDVDLPAPLNGTAESSHEPRKGRRTRWGQSASEATLQASSGSGAAARASGTAEAASQGGLSLSKTSGGATRAQNDAAVHPSSDEAAIASSAPAGVAPPLLVTALRPVNKPVTAKPGVTTSHIISDVASRAAAARAALEKAKKALAMQKQIQEQVTAMRAGQAGTSMAARGANALITAGVAAALRAMPQLKPMRFDRLGREIDAEGKVIDIKPLARSTLKVNINKEREAKLKQVVFQAKVDKNLTNPSVNRFFDPNLHVASTKSRNRGLSFVEKGFYSKRERQMRAREQAQNMGLALLTGEEKKRKEEEEQRRLEKVLQYQRDHQPEDPNDPDRIPSDAVMSDPATGRQLTSVNVERNALMAAVAAAAAAVESRRGVDATRGTAPGVSPEEAEEDQDMLMRPSGVTRRHEALHILQRRQTGIIPDIEWWDQPLLRRQDESHIFEDEDPAFPYVIAETTITDLVEHPVPIPPVVDIETPVTPVLHLTPKERLKLRRRKRQEREKDKQDKIRMGLIPPPPPKVKLANLARVLGTSAAANPSRVEQRVREQVAERQRAHQERNEARKLDADAKRKKKIAKWTQPSSEVQVPPGGAETCVFSIKDLSNRAHLFKVDKNAQQFHVTGAAIICPQFGNLVIAEGSRKALRGYKKLLLRRIKWSGGESQSTAEGTLLDGSKNTAINSLEKLNGNTETTHTEPDAEDEEESVPLKGRGSRLCRLLWEGVVKDRVFRQWRVYVFKSEAEVRKLLADRHCEHYWDMLKKYRDFSEDL